MAECSASVPPEAIQVLSAFLDAAQRRDEEGMKRCLNRRTIESGQFRNSGPENVRFVFGDAFMEGEQAVVPVKAYLIDGPADAPPAMEMACLIVKEDGAWKFDLAGTVDRMLGGDLGKAVEQMTTAMEGVGKAISEAMGSAFGEAERPEQEEPPTQKGQRP